MARSRSGISDRCRTEHCPDAGVCGPPTPGGASGPSWSQLPVRSSYGDTTENVPKGVVMLAPPVSPEVMFWLKK